MSRYIDADKLKINVSYGQMRDDDVLLIPLRDVYRSIDNAKTADVRENVHAHWEDWSFLGFDMGHHWYRRCSNCLCEREDDNEEKDTPFCPHCGAVMDERRTDDEESTKRPD